MAGLLGMFGKACRQNSVSQDVKRISFQGDAEMLLLIVESGS